ncbi:hypothetical protein HJG60_009124 [Phyllostomus discolor]|uniref:Uncharacterized protein n=1 Tax=Phyllostomus discolor TaxID=89673 RepID=A0A834DH93_9CHIR|nr:hypothetical protein HJG60_009124 [Phyllostomus discolor]
MTEQTTHGFRYQPPTLPCKSEWSSAQTESSNVPLSDFPPSICCIPGQLATLLMVNDSPHQPQGRGGWVGISHHQAQNFSIHLTDQLGRLLRGKKILVSFLPSLFTLGFSHSGFMASSFLTPSQKRI